MIAYRVVAVPARLERARALAAATGGEIVLDTEGLGTMANHQRALVSGAASGASHVCVLEDDAIVCGDFLTHVARLVAERPDHLLGLYVGRVAPRTPQPAIAQAVTTSPAWLDDPVIVDRLRWAVGYVMPASDVPAVLASLPPGGHPWFDTDKRLGRWHAEQGRLSYPFPSPVDHDDLVPSTTTRGRTGRVAWAHCKEDQNA